MKKMYNSEFILRARSVHGDRYDYSQVKYVNSRTKINIICKKHGMFEQTPSNHFAGQNCPICMKKGKSNNERFIVVAKNVHDDKYDYSLVNYINNKSKIKIICKEHGIFEQRPTRHLSGGGCLICNGGVGITQEEFIRRAKEKHNYIYEYLLVNYINSLTKIKIICKKHGVFEQKPNNHLLGQGCSKCAKENKFLTTLEFIKKAKCIHGNKYNYSLVDYKHNNIKIKIICSAHGVFEQKPCVHLNGRGCSQCKTKSTGELFISDWLCQNNISYETQKSFINCRNILPLRYDFYLPKEELLIEYDGEPHFKEIKYLGGKRGFELRQTNDKIKTKYARDNNIRLLRISYTERKNLSNILKNNLINT